VDGGLETGSTGSFAEQAARDKVAAKSRPTLQRAGVLTERVLSSDGAPV
jgi:hypothetical protein